MYYITDSRKINPTGPGLYVRVNYPMPTPILFHQFLQPLRESNKLSHPITPTQK